MKRIVIGIIIGVVLTFIALSALSAEQPSASIDIPAYSAYVWRGQVSDDKPVLQPSLTAGWLGFELNAFENYSTDAAEFNETDLTASYTYGWLTAGAIGYLYPGDSDTYEAFVTLAPDWTVAPEISVYRDLDKAEGWYGSIGLSYSHELTDKLSAELATSYGAGDSKYNAYYFGVDSDELNDGNVLLALPWQATDKLTLTPSIQYTWLLDGETANTVEDEDIVWGGLNVNYAF